MYVIDIYTVYTQMHIQQQAEMLCDWSINFIPQYHMFLTTDRFRPHLAFPQESGFITVSSHNRGNPWDVSKFGTLWPQTAPRHELTAQRSLFLIKWKSHNYSKMKETCQYGPLNAEQEYNEHATMTVHHACSCAIMCIDDFHKILDLYMHAYCCLWGPSGYRF